VVYRILFVCTGNTCRSPMAEGLCRSFLAQFHLQDEVDVASAGLQALDGGQVSLEAVGVMAEKGIDLSGHRTSCLTAARVQWADLILTMEERHRHYLLQQFPEAAGKVWVLKEYVASPEAASGQPAPQAGPGWPGRHDIPDPIGRPAEVYSQCAMELSGAIADLCLDIYRRLKRGRNPG
jgi:protein-tyrosine-phosphatase